MYYEQNILQTKYNKQSTMNKVLYTMYYKQNILQSTINKVQ